MMPCPNIVSCFVDPCAYSSCPSIPNAYCTPNYCGGCNAIWRHPITRKELTIAECDSLPPPPPEPKPCLRVYCLYQPCHVNHCPAYPEAICSEDYCGGCQAIFTDINTGRILTDEECGGIINPLPPPQVPSPGDIVCPEDLKQCPDGSYVGRDINNNCQFKPCRPRLSPPIPDVLPTLPALPSFPRPNPSILICDTDVIKCWDGTERTRDPINNCKFKDCPIDPLLNGGTTSTTSFPTSEPTIPVNIRPITPISIKPAPPKPGIAILCTADVKPCPDGSFVSRDNNNNCEFIPCPSAELAPLPEVVPLPIDITPIQPIGEINQLPRYCPLEVKQCPDGSFVARDTNYNCDFKPCPSITPQMMVNPASAGIGSPGIEINPQSDGPLKPSVIDAVCPKIGEKCSSEILNRNERCCNGGHGGTTKCLYSAIDQNGFDVGKCCIKNKKRGCKSNNDCCDVDGVCDIDGDDRIGIYKRDRNILKHEAAQQVEGDFDNFQLIKDKKGSRYMAISEATIAIIMIIILFIFPILYYIYYKKYIVQKVQQQARREIFHGLEIDHHSDNEFHSSSSSNDDIHHDFMERQELREQYVD